VGICDFLLVGFEFSRKISLNFQKRSENHQLFARCVSHPSSFILPGTNLCGVDFANFVSPKHRYHTRFVMVFKLESATSSASPAVEFEFTIVREFVRFSLIYLV